MAFDRNSEGKPLVHVERRTTQVNVWIGIAVAVFLLAAAGYLIHLHTHPAQTEQNVSQGLNNKP